MRVLEAIPYRYQGMIVLVFCVYVGVCAKETDTILAVSLYEELAMCWALCVSIYPNV